MARRDFRAEYRRRVERGFTRGLSRSQARGHPKPSESLVKGGRSPRPIDDNRLQLGLRVLRQEKSLAAAAKAAKVSPERLRRMAIEKNIVERKGRLWVIRQDLPRRMLLFSEGRAIIVTVGDFASASLIGRHMSAVSNFLRTNRPGGLGQFVGQSVTDTAGKTYVLETRRNTLYRLASANDQSFEQIYRIVI